MPYVSPEDRDYMIRTIIGEAEHEPAIGQVAATYTILNRVARGYANTAKGVVLSPWQYTTWHDRGNQLMKINPNSSRYQKVAANVDAAITGQVPDPTGGATHYLDPVWRAKHYKYQPPWSLEDKGIQIGTHVFHAPGQQGLIDNAVASGAPQQAQAAITAINRKPPQTAADAIPEQGGVPPGAKGSNEPMAFADIAASGLRATGQSRVGDAVTTSYEGAPATQELDLDAEARALRGEAGQPVPSTSVEQRFANPPNEFGDDAIDEEAKNLRSEAEQPDTASAMRAETATAPIAAKPDETSGQTLNRWLSENQGSSLLEGAARTGIGGLKGIQDVSNTLAQGISWLGQKGAQAAEGITLGKYKGEPVQPFKGAGEAAQKWREGINKRIDDDNAKFDELAGITGQVGRIGGNIAGSAIPGGTAAKVPVAVKAMGAVPSLVKGAGAGGLTALLSSSGSNEDVGSQITRGAALGALGGAAPRVAKWFDKQVHESRLTQIGIAALLGSAGMGHYAQDPSALQKDLAVAGAAALAIKAGKHADKIAPILSRALATPTGVDVTVKPAMEMLGAR